jgi:ER lumen protein retaining receptor
MEDKFSNIMENFKDSQSMMYTFKKNKKDLIFWILAIALIGFVYFFISSKDYSFLIVLSSIVQMLSFLIILLKVIGYESCSGLSFNTALCYTVLLIARLSSTLFYHGYLPSDEAGDWFYQLTEIITMISSICLLVLMKGKYQDTYDSQHDTLDYKYFVFPSLACALLVHTSLNKNLFSDVMWTFSMYLETTAIVPQLVLFHSKKGQIEKYTSHFVALQGLSRLFSLLFWYDTYQELNDEQEGSYSLFHEYCGYFIIFSQVTQLILMCDYYYFYFKSLWKGDDYMSVCSEI